MTYQIKPLTAGLYFVATPIGNARDITLRALDVLASADVLAAEDTRTLRKLMEIHGVPLGDRHIIAYHDHNGAKARPRLLGLMAAGKSVAYASEAGTPLVADPGFVLSREALAAGHLVTSAPGPSAMIAALTIAGLPSDRFLFAGFPPASKGARRTFFTEWGGVQATLGFYESPKRIHRTLSELCDLYGPTRVVAVCREITKRFEEVISGPVSEVLASIEARTLKGEIVLLVDRPAQLTAEDIDLDAEIDRALETLSLKDAAAHIAAEFGLKKREVYQRALERSKEDE
ncbi:16S rRNA (cytidine(1402)-2'-O)-methyltransferase [Celeribacter marinus]|uniref:16S rRNA (cytidine(1402)-2'-O)-methyltransferase n=1 Tax=Celeribacter marinus TaxID=1397108 RepID=UPI003F6B3D37